MVNEQMFNGRPRDRCSSMEKDTLSTTGDQHVDIPRET
jgi:hypothetical protein